MKRKLFNIALLLLVITLLSTSMIGCQTTSGDQKELETNTKTEKKETTSKEEDDKELKEEDMDKELTVMVYDRGNVPAEEGDITNNRWIDWLREESGFDLTYVAVSRWEAYNTLNVMFAAGTAPDIINEYSTSMVRQYANQGVFLEVSDYLEFAPNYLAMYNKHPEIHPFAISDDGSMYLLPGYRGETMNHGLWVRQDWLDILGLSAPTNDEEFISVAKAFRDSDINGTGQDDIIAVAGPNMLGMLKQMYMVDRTWYTDDGTIIYNAELTERYKDYMEFTKTLYDEKLMDLEFVTDADNERQFQFWVTDRTGFFFMQVPAASMRYPQLMENQANAEPVGIAPISTKYGTNGYHSEPAIGMYSALNANIDNPEAAMMYLDWFMTTAQPIMQYGIEGVHFEYIDDYPKAIDADLNKVEKNYSGDLAAVMNSKATDPIKYIKSAADDTVSQKGGQLSFDHWKLAEEYVHRQDVPFGLILTNDDIIQFNAEFVPLRDEIVTKVIIGGEEYTPEWGFAEIQKEWERLDGARIETMMQEWFDVTKVNFGY